jgi:hypothetical protein
MMERDSTDWIQRGRRQSARLTARAQMPDGTKHTVVMTEMSYEGCKLSSNRPFTKGQSVVLSVPGRGEVVAQIRWIKDGIAGARFVTGDSVRDSRRARLGI